MVSAGVCLGCKGPLHFVEKKAKVDCRITLATCFQISSKTAIACCLLPTGFIFQQDGVPAHIARSAQNWLGANCPDFITKDQWPPNSPDLNPMEYHVWGAMLQAYRQLLQQPKTIAELKEALQVIWGQPATGTDEQGCERLLKVTEGFCWSWRWTLGTFTVTIEFWHLIIS